MIRTLTALVAASILIAAPASADSVHTFKNGSVQVEKADRKVKVKKVIYTEKVGSHLYAELSNGATFELVPCLQEDSRNCHWDARSMGNGKGASFVNIRGKVIFI